MEYKCKKRLQTKEDDDCSYFSPKIETKGVFGRGENHFPGK